MALATALASLGCAGAAEELAAPPDMSELRTLEGARCSVASTRPLVVDWSSPDRGALEARLRAGVTLVRFTGCALQVVDDCTMPRASYTYEGFTPKHEEHHFSTADALHAELPVGASSLEATLKKAGRVDVAMTIVGRWESTAAAAAADDLEGEGCARGTHFVRAFSVGAFQLVADGQGRVGGSLPVPQAFVGGAGEAGRAALRKDGDERACEAAGDSDAAPPFGCGALLRLELAAIDGRARPARVVRKERVCPPGQRWRGSSCEEEPSAPRIEGSAGHFVVRADVVFDTATGLTWQRAPSEHRLSWEEAKSYCNRLELGGESSFRLPKKSELVTLVERSSASPRIDAAAFPTTPSAPFWTFSPDRSSPGDAWAIDFGAGTPTSTGTGTHLDVRCVR